MGLLVTFLTGDSFVNASEAWAFLGMTSWWLMFGYLAPVPLAIGRGMDIWREDDNEPPAGILFLGIFVLTPVLVLLFGLREISTYPEKRKAIEERYSAI